MKHDVRRLMKGGKLRGSSTRLVTPQAARTEDVDSLSPTPSLGEGVGGASEAGGAGGASGASDIGEVGEAGGANDRGGIEASSGSARPETLADFVGQPRLCNNLHVFIQAALSRRQSIDHVLFSGPPGLGKTTLARIVAQESGVGFHATSGPVISKAGDLAAILTALEPRDVLFIDEIHRLNPAVEEMLYPAMEDFQLDILIGSGPAARSVRIDLSPFTLVGATTRSGMVSRPLRERFGIPLALSFYHEDDLLRILKRYARLPMLRDVVPPPRMSDDAGHEVARRSRGTPRIALRLLRRVIDFATAKGEDVITGDRARESLKKLGVDPHGFDSMDRRYLRTLADNYQGGPVGIETLCAILCEQRDVVEDVIEPFLLRDGVIDRTKRGRILSAKGWKYLGRTPPQNQQPCLDMLDGQT